MRSISALHGLSRGNARRCFLIVRGYPWHWRVEESHQSWKSGVCDVKGNQLHGANAVKQRSIILATVAARIERLRRLATRRPEGPPATIAFTLIEIRAPVLASNEPLLLAKIAPSKFRSAAR
jgi:hypothetical protein